MHRSWGSIAESSDKTGCKLGSFNKCTDQVGPTNQRKKQRIPLKIGKKRVNALGSRVLNYPGPTSIPMVHEKQVYRTITLV